MEKNVPTILKSLLQTCKFMGKDYPILANSTLNQKLSVNASETLDPSEYPIGKYFMIGNGGLKLATGPDSLPFAQSYRHKPTDTGLFSEIPFIVRPTNADIGDIARANYRMRKVITVGSSQYYAYFAKAVNVANATSVLQRRTVEVDGSVTATTFIPTSDDLSPEPEDLASNTAITTTNKYVAASTKVDFILTAQDVAEIVAGCQTLYGEGDLAIISEIAYCAGADRTIGNMTEAICMQVMNFLSTNFPAASLNQGVKYTFDIGNAEPLLELSPD